MIIVSEIGDKTFIIAALMAMRCSPLFVYSAALSALVAMTLLSALLGRSVPTLLPDTYTKMLAAVLFFAFGLKMLKEGYEMAPNEGLSSEISEVETELKEKDHERVRDGDQDTYGEIFDVEAGHDRQDCPADQSPASLGRNLSASHQFPGSVRCHWQSLMAGMSNLFSLFLSPLFVQIFAMTFFAEWGDRSQLSTVVMATGPDYWLVILGAVSGHALCTGIAVIGGRAIAGRVSMRVGKWLPCCEILDRN